MSDKRRNRRLQPLRPLRPLLRWLCAGAAGCLLFASVSSAQGSPRAPGSKTVPQSGEIQGPIFVDRAADWGIDFVHFNGMNGSLYFAENVGSGCGLLDYDGDGDLDAYLVQGALLGPEDTLEGSTFPPPPHMRPVRDRLYRNDLVRGADGAVEARFTDVTAAAGLDAVGYGMGLAAGDLEGDGDWDLYAANHGPNHLFRNRGDGTFEEITAGAGADDTRFSVAATFFDANDDGEQDLYVANYVGFTMATHQVCYAAMSSPEYCGPLVYPAQPDRLLLGRPDGTFEDATARAGLAELAGTALGVVAGDFDGAGGTDLFVANDQMENYLLLGRGDGTFEESALLAGLAFNEQGQPEASMGIALGDYNADGREDIFLTHMADETNTLYRNDGAGLFTDVTLRSGLGAPSFPYTGFGTEFLDYDNDGDLDLVAVNGNVRTIEAQARSRDPYPLKQPNQLFTQGPDGTFTETPPETAGESFGLLEVSRGAAFGDVDGDGDTDVLVSNNSGPARLLVNRVGADPERRSAAGWLGVRVRAAHSANSMGADAVGTLLRLDVPAAEGAKSPGAENRVRIDRVHLDGSYASVNDPRVLFGLGGAEKPGTLTLTFPGGERREIRGLPADTWVTVPAPAPGGGGKDR